MTDSIFDEVISNYQKAGFKIYSDHNRFTGVEPFNELFERLPAHFLKRVWDDLMPESYKKTYINNQSILEGALKSDILSPNNIIYFDTYEKADFYIKNILSIEILSRDNKIIKYQNIINNFVHSLSPYPITNHIKIMILKKIHEEISKESLTLSVNDLGNLFNNKTEKVNYEEKTLISLIKTHRLYEKQFTNKEKNEQVLLNKVLNLTEVIVKHKNLNSLIEEKTYLEILLNKHLPEMLADYIEIPEEIRTTFIHDINGKTSQKIINETLNDLLQKVISISHNTYEENMRNLRVKNNLMKMSN